MTRLLIVEKDPECSFDLESRNVERSLRRDASENRVRILESARSLFAERGLGVTLDDIAHHANLGVGTVYRRFPNKDLLVQALFEEAVLELIEVGRHALEFEDAWEGFLFLLKTMLDMETKDRGLREVILGNDYIEGRITELKKEVGPLIEEIVRRAQDQGGLRGDFHANDVPVIAAMAGAAQEYSKSVSPNLWKRYVAIVLDGLRVDRPSLTPMSEEALDQDQLIHAMINWKARK